MLGSQICSERKVGLDWPGWPSDPSHSNTDIGQNQTGGSPSSLINQILINPGNNNQLRDFLKSISYWQSINFYLEPSSTCLKSLYNLRQFRLMTTVLQMNRNETLSYFLKFQIGHERSSNLPAFQRGQPHEQYSIHITRCQHLLLFRSISNRCQHLCFLSNSKERGQPQQLLQLYVADILQDFRNKYW